MRWLWTFGRVPELEAEGIAAVSQRILALTEAQRTAPDAPRIIDVRTAGEYRAGHIAGALHASFLPPWSWPSSVAPLLEGVAPGAELYVICLSAHRSIGALKWLRERGYSRVRQLKGGMQAWRARDLPEVRGNRPDGDGGGGVEPEGSGATAAAGEAGVAGQEGDEPRQQQQQ